MAQLSEVLPINNINMDTYYNDLGLINRLIVNSFSWLKFLSTDISINLS